MSAARPLPGRHDIIQVLGRTAMEAEHINAIARRMKDVGSRTEDLWRYL